MASINSFGTDVDLGRGIDKHSSCGLDSTHAAIVYRDSSDIRQVAIVSRSGTTATVDTTNEASLGLRSCVELVKIDSSHFLSLSLDGGDGLQLRLFSVSETTPTREDWIDISTGIHDGQYGDVCVPDSTHWIVTGRNDYGEMYVESGTISGGNTLASNGDNTEFPSSGYPSSPRLCALSSTSFVHFYEDGNGNKIYATVGSFDGSEITLDSGNTTEIGWDEDVHNIEVCAMDSTHFVVSETINGFEVYVFGASVSGTTITDGTPVHAKDSSNNELFFGNVKKIDSDSFIFVGGGTSGQGGKEEARYCTLSGTSVSLGTRVEYDADCIRIKGGLNVGIMDSNYFIVNWGNDYTCDYEHQHVRIGLIYYDPTVTTQAATSVEETTATGNGNVTDDGGDSSATRGFCWSTSPNPDKNDLHSTNGTGEGSYTISITSLSPGTLYYGKAYSVNSEGTSYGSQVTFTTKPQAPTSLSASGDSHTQASVSWTKGTGATKTMVRRKAGSYPTSVSDGDEAYNDTGNSFTDSGLTSQAHYYYRAWSWVSGSDVWSDSYVSDDVDLSETAFDNPANAYSSDDSYATASAADGDIIISLSKDGGSTFNTELTKTFTGTEISQTYGDGSTETWGTSWTGDDVDDTSFALKVQVDNGDVYQIYKNFGFSIGSSYELTGIEVSVEAKWDGSTTYIDHIKVKCYYGESVLPIVAGSQAYASDCRKNGETAGNGSGSIVFFDGNNWIAVDSGDTAAA